MPYTPKSTYKPLETPQSWPDHYSEEDIANAAKVIDWLNEKQVPISHLSTLARVDKSMTYRTIHGQYKSPPTGHLTKLLSTIAHQDRQHSVREVPFVESTVSKLAFAACKRARTYKSFAILSAFVGTGKTRSLKEYQRQYPNTYLIEADPGMSVQALLDALVRQIGCDVKKSAPQHTKYTAIIDELTGTDTLLIIDEAETLTPKALHNLRRIRDKAGIGIVLAGTEGLNALIKPVRGEFDQIRSRTNFWPSTAHGITRDDAVMAIEAAFADRTDLTDDVTERLWRYCGGSMRMLVEDLIPALRDFGLAKHDLSVALVDNVALKVLNLQKPD